MSGCGWWKVSGSGRRILWCLADWPHASSAHVDAYGQQYGDWYSPADIDALLLRERRWLSCAIKAIDELDALKLRVPGHTDMRKLILEARAIYRVVRVAAAAPRAVAGEPMEKDAQPGSASVSEREKEQT